MKIMLKFEMILKNRIPAAAGALCIAGCLSAVTSIVAAQKAPENVATAQRETLLQTTQSWNGKRYTHYPIGQPQLTTLKVTIAAHTSLPWHYHPIPNALYVLSEPSHCTIGPAVRLWSFIRGKPPRSRSTMFIGAKQATSRLYC
jgi:hypothetical protein